MNSFAVVSFSVTPLEALATGTLVASDRRFVRDVVQDAALYFDPRDPVSVATAVRGLLSDGPGRERRRRLGLGLELVASWPTAADRPSPIWRSSTRS